VPRIGAALLASVLTLAVVALVGAATSRHSYRRTRLAGAGGIGVAALDIAMLTVVLLAAPHGWPMVPAVAVSLARVAITVRILPRALAHR
jgi:CHASE2 domain-containing sensor protein